MPVRITSSYSGDHRSSAISHQNGLDKETELSDIVPESFRDVEFSVTIGGHNDSYVIQINDD